MIDTIAALLDELKRKESEALSKHEIKHTTIIGDMYEGLTKKILEHAIPLELDLCVVSGVIRGAGGRQSRQLDCILVSGQPERIPHTDSFMCDPQKVVAVVESKKKLYSQGLMEGYQEVRSVEDVHTVRPMAQSGFNQAYRDIVGQHPPDPDDYAREPFELRMLYCALVAEHNLPLRVVLGYEGFATEKNFRSAFVRYLESNLGVRGFGPVSFPNLIISGDYSLVKLSGQPYAARMEGLGWNCLASTKYNPTMLLLEHLWDRLQCHYSLPHDIWGDGLSLARMNRLVSAVCVQEGEKIGWAYNVSDIQDSDLKSAPAQDEWSPEFLGDAAFVIFNELMKRDVNTDEPDFKRFCESNGYTVAELVTELIQTGLVACKGATLLPLTRRGQAGILPDGRYFAADDVEGDLTKWLERYMRERKSLPKRIELP